MLMLRSTVRRCTQLRTLCAATPLTTARRVTQGDRCFDVADGYAAVASVSSPASSEDGAATSIPSSLSALLLPVGYPATVSSAYMPYTLWAAAAAIASSASGVLATQSLLYAVGLGAGAIPMSAALNWVLKDGLGQVGGMLFVSFVNNRFDADPKRFRMASAIALDAAAVIEIATPLFPGLFLPLAAIANVGKNVAWLSASATRAGIHQALSQRSNLSDVTAKSGSQTIAASTSGMAIGILLSTWLGAGAATPQLVLAFGTLSALHLGCVWKALACLHLPTLGPWRMDAVIRSFLETGKVPPPGAVAETEPIAGWLGSHLLLGARLSHPRIAVNPTIDGPMQLELPSIVSELESSGAPHVVRVRRSSDSAAADRIDLFYTTDATSEDVLTGYLHASVVRQELQTGGSVGTDDVALVQTAAQLTANVKDKLLTQLEDQGWWVAHPLLEQNAEAERLQVHVQE